MDQDLYFNEWAFLARTDPEIFERRRKEYIGSFLSGTGVHRPRLEALQARIDAQRSLADTPEEAVMAISTLMCDSLADLAGKMKNLCTDLRDLGRPEAGSGIAAAKVQAAAQIQPASSAVCKSPSPMIRTRSG